MVGAVLAQILPFSGATLLVDRAEPEESDGPVGVCRRQEDAVGREGEVRHAASALAERDALLQRGAVEDLDGAVGEADGEQLAVSGREGERLAEKLVEHSEEQHPLLRVVPELEQPRVARAREARQPRVRRQAVHRRVLPLDEKGAAPRLRRQLVEHGRVAADYQRVLRRHHKVGARELAVLRRRKRLGLVRKGDGAHRACVEVFKPCDDAELLIEEAHVAVGAAGDHHVAHDVHEADGVRVQLHQLGRTPVG
mmetsp:Transcript_1258/g.2588  ORF Transcript_1258/g.2588 Transcript_1258/m.2588 type:complete len:253 (+) Transcript_1258:186-944(+)